MMPIISFIVPIYKTEKYISQCIHSIIDNNEYSIEIILVDDGSPDNCPQICDSFAQYDRRIKTIHQENKGVSAARNTGIEIARGEYLYFVDSDDYIDIDAIIEAYHFSKENDLDIAFVDCIELYDNGYKYRLKLFSVSFVSDNPTIIYDIQKSILCHKYNPYFIKGADDEYPAPWSKLIKSSIVKNNKVLFDPTVRGVYDDGLFSVEILQYVKKIGYNGNIAYFYRVIGSSTVHRFNSNSVKVFEINCKCMEEFTDKYNKDLSFRQAEYGRRVAYLSEKLTSYFYNPNNPAKRSDVKRELYNTIFASPWKEAVCGARYQDLEAKHKYTLFCMRHRLLAGLRFYSFAKRIIRRGKY